VEETAAHVAAQRPDAVVLIDAWGFMWRLADRLRSAAPDALRIKLIGPQVWATRPGRAGVLAQVCDHLLCIHDFEAPHYQRHGLPVTVVGNPALARMRRGDGAGFRAQHAIGPERRIVGLLPGSRRAEIRRVAPVLAAACERLCQAESSRLVVCVAAQAVADAVRAEAAGWRFPHLIVPADDAKPDAFAAMDVALCCSGTVTTEVALQGAPVIVGYKLGWITWAIARLWLMRARFISLLNTAAGREIAPEFVQTRLTAARVADAAERLLADDGARRRQVEAQNETLGRMAGSGRPAADIAAETVLQLIGARRGQARSFTGT
jgi:lipid-A-disaccharide synthase